jgi:MBG domain (YGX type)
MAFNGSTSAPVKDAGTYSQTVGTLALSATNYVMAFSNPTPNNYVITAKSVNVAADSGQFKAKGTSDPTFTYTADSLVGGDSYSGALSRAAGETPGSYAITIGTLTAGSNYLINFAGANFIITGPIAVNDTGTRLGGSSSFNVPISSLLPNDSRVASDGSSHTDGLSITTVAPGTGVDSAQLSGSNVSVTVTDPLSNADVIFTYTLSDGNSTDTGIVTVSTIPLTLQIVAVESRAYNSGTNTTTTTVDLLGTPNQNYTIEYSTDLATWSLYSGNPVHTGTGTFSITVTAPGNHTAFFFRASE